MDTWRQTGVSDQFLSRGKPADITDLGGDGVSQNVTDPGDRFQQRHIGMVNAESFDLNVDLFDLCVEMVDKFETSGHALTLWFVEVESLEGAPAALAEQIRNRARPAMSDQHRMDPVSSNRSDV